MRNNTRVFTVELAEDDRGGWRVVNRNGRCLRRASTKKEAIRAGAELARNSTMDTGHFRPSDAQLEILDREGFLLETRNYSR